MGTSDGLVDFARSFVEGKQPLLHIYRSAAIALACWLNDLQSGAAADGARRVHRLAARTNDKISDEMTWAQSHHRHCCCTGADHV
jgi:hypothetical protein